MTIIWNTIKSVYQSTLLCLPQRILRQKCWHLTSAQRPIDPIAEQSRCETVLPRPLKVIHFLLFFSFNSIFISLLVSFLRFAIWWIQIQASQAMCIQSQQKCFFVLRALPKALRKRAVIDPENRQVSAVWKRNSNGNFQFCNHPDDRIGGFRKATITNH